MSSLPLGLLVGWIGLGTGALALLVQGVRATRHLWHHLLAFLVPAVTALSYTAMAFGQGVATLPTGRVYFWARWADAPFSATVLILNTALIALPRASVRRSVLFTGLAAANSITMASGLLAGFATTPAPQWTWYAIGSGAYAAVLWMLFVRVPREAQRQEQPLDRRRTFWQLAVLLIGASVLYPLWWIVTPLGAGWVGTSGALLGFAVLDVVSKSVYGLLLVRAVRRLPDAMDEGRPR
jgi:bacteriorhodopsin